MILVIPAKKIPPRLVVRSYCSTPQKGKIRLRRRASYGFSQLTEKRVLRCAWRYYWGSSNA